MFYVQVKYYRDTYAEHPDDRENIEYSVHLDSNDALVTLTGLYNQLKDQGFDLQYFRFKNHCFAKTWFEIKTEMIKKIGYPLLMKKHLKMQILMQC